MSQQPIYQPSAPNHSLIHMPTNVVFKQDGAKSIVASRVYQVAYCLVFRYSAGEVWWQIWYLLQCPIFCMDSLTEAHRKAKEWKVQLGAKFQPVIIGETDGDFKKIGIDNLFGITAIGGLDASELECPDFLLEEGEYS
jgi:hypothetical protein